MIELTGKIRSLSFDFKTERALLTLEANEKERAAKCFEDLKDCEKLSFKIAKYRKKRSLDANGMLWACLGEIAAHLRADKWDIYLLMLKRYGKFTHIIVKENVVDAVKAQWRETEVVGEITVNGQKAVQMLCYFGSSTYNTKEFSVLLDGVISEMKEMGLDTPLSEDMKRALAIWDSK